MRMQVFIGNQEAFVDESTRPKITKQISDIQNPESRKGDRTLSFTMPGTPENDRIFGAIFEVNLEIQSTTTQFSPDFNPNLRASFRLLVDTVPNLTGYCQLSSITKTRENKIEYTLVAYGTTADLFSVIADSLVEDLDFSEYNHEWNITNIENSWNTSIVENSVAVPFELGKGYVYPMIDYGINVSPSIWKVNEFRPSIYAKEYVDKIFEAAGFTYTSTFFDSERFKRLVIPYVGDELKLTNADAATRLFDVERITSSENLEPIAESSPGVFDFSTYDALTFNFINSDPSGQWTTDTFVAINQGKYIFQASLTFAINNNAGFDIANKSYTVIFGMFHIRGGAVIATYDTNLTAITAANLTNGSSTSTAVSNIQFPEITMYANDSVVFAPIGIEAFDTVFGGSGLFLQGDGLRMVNAVGSLLRNQLGSEQIIPGDTMPLNSTLPINFKQRDFLVGLIRLFNLYIAPNPDQENNLIIEPRDTYYTTDVTDWTYKLDEDKGLQIEPMGLLDAERYTFQYSEDGDYLNNLHNERYGFSYGRRRYVVVNDFVTSEKVIQAPFAPTPLYAAQAYSSLIVSQIEFVDQQGRSSVKAAKPRILYYGGLINKGSWVLTGAQASGITQTTYTSYPYAGHLDNPYTPTFDLNYGAPKEIYYGASFIGQGSLQYTENNLYKAYWQKYIEETTNKDSKVVKGYFYLNAVDIYNLNFRNLYLIKEAYYRLLKVTDYDPISNTPCLCEFIKIQNVPQEPVVTETFNGGTGTLGADDLPVWDLPRYKDGNVYSPREGKGIILGDDNNVGGGTIELLVVGSSNQVGGGIERGLVLGGDSNQILAEGVTVINSSGQIVTEPDTTIIGGIRYAKRVIVDVSSAEMLALGSTPKTVVLSPGANRFIETINVHARRNNSTIGYSSQVIVLQYTTSGINTCTFATELLTATGDGIYKATINPDLSEDNGLQLTTQSGADPTTGDGDYTFYIDIIYQNI